MAAVGEVRAPWMNRVANGSGTKAVLLSLAAPKVVHIGWPHVLRSQRKASSAKRPSCSR